MNWCPHLKTTLSDLEVDYVDVEGPTRLPLPGERREGVNARASALASWGN